MDRSNLKDQEKPPTAPPRPHHSITTGPTQLPPSPNTRQPAQPSAVTASPTIRPSPQATPKDTSHLVAHCEQMRYRVAVLDTPPGSLPSEARTWRNSVTSDGGHGALYHPWVVVQNPFDGSRLVLPPSGFVAGIWARNDTENAVFKAPANEPIRSAIELESAVSRGQQEMLNPEGVNCLRYFPGRGNRVWGARTISDDPEWKYVSLRRYFAYLEHSIERGTQWAVFMNNGEALWANVRRTIEEFLLNEWKTGGLLGASAKEAYFVECERKTMTQNDLDNGRLVCKVGVAAVKPAEFVIFRIGQWTASATS